MASAAPGRSRWWVALLTLLGLGLRLYGLGGLSLWNDEAVSLESALSPSLGSLLVFNLWADVHPPLYPFLLRLWLAPGPAEYLARFFSVATGVFLIPVVYQVGRRPFGERWGRLAAFLAAVSPFLVYYSREVRMYSLAALLVALSLLFFLRVVVGEGRWAWAGFAASTLAALYTDYPAFLVLVGLNGFVLLFWRRYQPLLRPWLAMQALLLALYLPGLAGAAYQAANRAGGFWLPPATWEAIPYTLASFALGHTLEGPPQLLAMALAIGVLAAWMARWPADRRMVLLALWLFFPMAGLYLASLFLFPVYIERSLIVSVPPLIVAASLGLQALPWALPRYLLHGAWLALAMTSLFNLYGNPGFARAALAQGASLLAKAAEPEDLVVHTSFLSYEPMMVYHRLLGRSRGEELLLDPQRAQEAPQRPLAQTGGLGAFLLSATPLGSWREEALRYRDEVLRPGYLDEAALEARAQGRSRLWVVEMTPEALRQVAQLTFLQGRYWQPPPPFPLAEAAWLGRDFRLESRRRLPGLSLYLYQKAT